MFNFIVAANLFVLLFLISSSIIYWSLKSGISPMPSSSLAKKKLLALPRSPSNGNIYELGSGWGTLAFAFAKKYPNCTVKAFEISLIPYLFSLFRLYLFPQSNLQFYRADFFAASLEDASLIICYLYPKAMEKLKGKFEKELPLGCLIFSNTFAIPGFDPLEIIELEDLYHTKIYVYQQRNYTEHVSKIGISAVSKSKSHF